MARKTVLRALTGPAIVPPGPAPRKHVSGPLNIAFKRPEYKSWEKQRDEYEKARAHAEAVARKEKK